MIAIFMWLIIATVFTLLGSRLHNNMLLGTGGVMLLLMASIAGIAS